MKKKIKGLWSFLLIIVVMSFMPMSVTYASSGNISDTVKWNYTSYKLTISGTGEIPDNVISFDSYCPSAKEVVIEEGITGIGAFTFYDMDSLTTVTLPSTLKNINQRAFSYCDALTSIVIPESVESLGEEVFLLSGVTDVTFKGDIQTLSTETFSYCKNLKSVNFEGMVSVIEKKAFYSCIMLETIEIPEGVTEIQDNAFEGCTALTAVNLPDSVNVIGEYVFKDCTALKSVKLPSSLAEIPEYTFVKCTSLEEIIFPTVDFTIGDYAFSGCSGLTEIVFPKNLQGVGKYILLSCSGLKTVSVPFVGASRTSGGAADGVFGYLFGQSSTGEYVVANQYYSVLNFVEYCIPTALEKIYITDATQIPYGSFEGCLGIEYIELNEGITQISQFAFANCEFISVHMPASVTRIGSNAFQYTDVEKLYVSIDSYCHNYAVTNGYPYEIYGYNAVAGVDINETEINVLEGNTYSLTASILPENATYTDVIWSSSDENIATVSENGAVTAVSRGTAVITATTQEGAYTDTCTVNVLRAVTAVVLDCSEINIGVGHSKTLTATVYPSGASDKTVVWSSSNENVATVSNGIVTAVGYGTAVITVTTNDGAYTASCTVITSVPVSSVSLNKTSASMYVGDTLSLVATVLPSDAYNKSVIWSSSDDNIAYVSSGTVTALFEGIATITATTVDGGYTATCAVTVNALETDVPVDENAPYVAVSSIKTTGGNTVTVEVSIKNNPGFVSLGLEIDYDSEYLTLTNVKAESSVGATYTGSQTYSTIPYYVGWKSTSNIYYDGVLATLTFEIAQNAPDGNYPLRLSYYTGRNGNYTDGFDVNYDESFEPLGLSYVNGNIAVVSYTPGDIDGSGTVNDRDATYLLRYLAGWEQTGIIENALDVDGSGTVNDRDATTLLRYLAGWDIELQ